MGKRPTQKDVADRAGVSRATVSYVVNGLAGKDIPITPETRRRVRQAIKELNYLPDARAQSLRSGSLRSVSLLIPTFHNPHHWQIAAGVEQYLKKHNYDLVLSTTHLDSGREGGFLSALSRRRVDGLILLLTFSQEQEERVQTLVGSGLPVVLLGRKIEGLDHVGLSYYEGAQALMDHLLQLGHRHISFIRCVAHPAQGQSRLLAYQEKMQAAGLKADAINGVGKSIADGYEVARSLLERKGQPRPTAIVVINDMLAMGVLRAVAEAGLSVPEDISVASFDNIQFAAFTHPPLTTVHVDAEALGCKTATVLLNRLQNPNLPPQCESFSAARLIERQSTGPAPD